MKRNHNSFKRAAAVVGLTAVAALLLLAARAMGQCQDGRCQAPAGWHLANAFEWREESGELHLYYGGLLTGGWDNTRNVFRDYFGGRGWGPEKDAPPCPLPPAYAAAAAQARAAKASTLATPCDCAKGGPCACSRCDCATPIGAVAGEDNYGLDLSRMRPADQPKYKINGREVDRRQAFEALGGDAQLPDDADALRVTWVGDPAEGERVKAALAAAGVKATFQSYPDCAHPMTRGLGFCAPGLHVQGPDGRALWFAEAAAGDQLAEGLQLAEARRKDPKWEPEKWRPLAKPDEPRPLDGMRDLGAFTAWVKQNVIPILIVAGVGVFLLKLRRPPAA